MIRLMGTVNGIFKRALTVVATLNLWEYYL